MEEQVLSIKQMKELEELGIDTSNASMFWHNYNTYSNPKWEVCCTPDVRDIPTFTLQDILIMLSKLGLFYPNLTRKDKSWLCYRNGVFCKGNIPTEVAFEMLKYVKQNEYI